MKSPPRRRRGALLAVLATLAAGPAGAEPANGITDSRVGVPPGSDAAYASGND